MSGEKSDSTTSHSFTSRVVAKLKDPRFWLIAGSSLILSGLVIVFLKDRLATFLALVIGLTSSYLIRQIDDLPMPRSKFVAATFYEKTFVPALVGLVFISGSDIFSRIWVMPWRWFHGEDAVPGCAFLLSAAGVDLIGIIFSCVVVATLMGRRSNFAIMFGLAFYIPLNISDVFRGQFAEKSARLLASSCNWQMDDPTTIDMGAYRFGMATGILSRAFLAIFIAKLILSWRAARRDSVSEDEKKA